MCGISINIYIFWSLVIAKSKAKGYPQNAKEKTAVLKKSPTHKMHTA